MRRETRRGKGRGGAGRPLGGDNLVFCRAFLIVAGCIDSGGGARRVVSGMERGGGRWNGRWSRTGA